MGCCRYWLDCNHLDWYLVRGNLLLYLHLSGWPETAKETHTQVQQKYEIKMEKIIQHSPAYADPGLGNSDQASSTAGVFKQQRSGTIEFIKWIAIIAMAVDHIGLLLYPDLTVLRMVGRIALPLFGYLLIHNYLFFTSDKKKYILRLWVFAVISQPLFYYIVSPSLNIFVMLALALSSIYLIESTKEAGSNRAIESIIGFVIVSLAVVFSLFINYGVFGFALLMFMYLSFTKSEYAFFVFLSIALMNFSLTHVPYVFCGFLFYPIIYFSGQLDLNTKRMKPLFFYAFYPTHLLIISLFTLS
jgi:hypothetical protein